MKPLPHVTIIVLDWNAAEDTIECVQSLEKITYSNCQIYLVDNHSDDDSVQILKSRFPQLPLIQTSKNLGFAGGNNVGINRALDTQTDYILILNNDTMVEEDFLEPLVQSAESDNTVGIVGGKILHYHNRDRIWYAGGRINWIRGSGFGYGQDQLDTGKYDKEKSVSFITGGMMLIKLSLLETIGLINEDYFLYLEDTDYCIRDRRKGYQLVYNPNSRIYHKRDIDSARYATTLYYSTRNRLILMARYGRWYNRMIFFPYFYSVFAVKFIVWILSGQMDYVKSGWAAIRDFHRMEIA